ncbi:MAG: hypothetical protein ACREUU_04865, partial [Gammaproteobacteria bacterium]
DYTFRIFGDLEGEQIDESFSSGPETFSSVDDVSELQFPNKLSSNADLQDSIDTLRQKVDNLDTGGGSDTATILAFVAIVVAALSFGAGAYTVFRRRS